MLTKLPLAMFLCYNVECYSEILNWEAIHEKYCGNALLGAEDSSELE